MLKESSYSSFDSVLELSKAICSSLVQTDKSRVIGVQCLEDQCYRNDWIYSRDRSNPVYWPTLFIALLCMLHLVFLAAPGKAAQSEAASEMQLEIAAEAAILIDRSTGEVLYEKNADAVLPMASTTKIMTLLVALEEGNLSDDVTVSEKASGIYGSRIYLDVNERQSLHDLLYALMLSSANDAAIAIAEHIGGTEERFVDMMNRRAEQMNLRQTHFTNPHGLTAPDHHTTARELATLARYAMLYEQFQEIVLTKKHIIPWPAKNSTRELNNINELIYRYPEATGIKTGYTSAAGQCIVASAKRGEDEVIAVILGAQDRGRMYQDAKTMLEYGLDMFADRVLPAADTVRTEREVFAGDKVEVVAAGHVIARLPISVKEEDIEKYFFWKPTPTAPLERGYRMGTLQYRVHGETVAEVPLVTTAPVEREVSIRSRIWPTFALILVTVYSVWLVRRHVRRRKRMRRLMASIRSGLR